MARHAGGVRIAATSESLIGANYRLLSPLLAMERRGHEIVWPDKVTGVIGRRELLSSDGILVFRCHDAASRKLLREARDQGVGIVWDVDDDMRNSPFSPFGKHAGLHRRQQIYNDSLNAARLADVVITSSDVLRDLYESAGIGRIEVLENYLLYGTANRRARKHPGFVIGWVAGREHELDAQALAIADTLARIQLAHPHVRVECFGVDLDLANRYTHTFVVPFHDLPAHMAGWDIGLAPIADTTFNAARSNIKVKEYAASCVPWLASARGPYANLGEGHGGRLVDDNGWFAAIDALIRDRRGRKRLARAGRSWAKGQSIDAVADRYEALFAEAASRSARAVTVA
jgi:glycosyltransferase involved in cell wall biosynthesis